MAPNLLGGNTEKNGRLSQVLRGGQDQETRSKLEKNENLVL